MARTSTVIDIPVARAYVPALQPARYKGLHGGRGSAKSRFFAGNLIREFLVDPTTRFVCVREIQLTLQQSVKRLIEDEIKRYDVSDRFEITTQQIKTKEGGLVIFQGMQDHTAESIKSVEGFDRAWVEEAQTLSDRSLTLLRPTIRKERSEIWLSWNPRFPTDPVDKLLRGRDKPPNSVVIGTTFRDNPWFPKVLRDEMLWDRQRDPEKYAHVWLGEYERHSEARVFKNWRVAEFEAGLHTEFLFGGDWGFSVDPSVLLRGFIIDTTLYIDYERYRVGCEIDDTPRLFDGLVCGCDELRPYDPCLLPEQHGMARNWQIVTDSARPETISYMQRHDYPRIIGAKKGPGSIEEGITFLKSYDIVVHPRCTHTIDELTHYSFKRHQLTGEVIPILEDKKNHVIDSARYMVESVRDPVIPWVC